MTELDTDRRRAPERRPVDVETKPEVTPLELSRFLREVLSRPVNRPGLETIVMPLPSRFDPVALLGSLRGVDAWYFRTKTTSGRELLGLGSARRATPVGPGRFVAAQTAIAGWLAEASVVRHPEAPLSQQRAFVGFAFAPGAAASEPWEPFGDALAVLPRWTLSQSEGERTGSLELTLDRTERDQSRIESVLAELAELLSARGPHLGEVACALSVDHEPPELHRARVQAVLDQIGKSELEKVVVARRSAVRSDHDLDATAALARFLSRDDEGTVYFVRRAGSVLLGVTPERLLSVHGHALETEALAGTAPRDRGEALEKSDKDREEHRFVVASIEETLEPLAKRVRVASTPELAPAGSVVHLKTRISATLDPEIHPLEVASALHPTPAVAGTPKLAATEWIARTEPERGWYSSPIGWVDGRGDAELFVALRGGVIRGARAWAFSGGGIVRGSQPDQELEEAVLKMGGFLRALGVT